MILGALVLFFALAWLLCRRLSFYSLVDVFWAFAFLPVVILQGAGAGGWVPRRVLLASLMGLWSLRLTLHLGLRLAAHFPHEDRRYVALREAKGVRWPLWSFVFFQGQGLVVWWLCRPFAGICASPIPAWSWFEVVGFAALALAIAGEGLADLQLARWRRANPGKLCRQGLWAWSRHPNYFFQILLWVAVTMIAWPAGAILSAALCALMMIHLILRVTGVPLAEKLSSARYGEEFGRYQREVNSLVPWPPKSVRQG